MFHLKKNPNPKKPHGLYSDDSQMLITLPRAVKFVRMILLLAFLDLVLSYLKLLVLQSYFENEMSFRIEWSVSIGSP